MSDPVNHPQHYRTDSGLEAIEVIEAFFPNDYHLGNAFKYLARAGKKDDEVQDLEKAVWYINRRIESVKDDGAAIRVGDRVVCTGEMFDPAAAAIGTVVEFNEVDDKPWTKVKEDCWKRSSNGMNWSDKEVQENVEEWTVTSVTEPDYSNPPEGALGTIMGGTVLAKFVNGAWAIGVLDTDPTLYGHEVTITEWPLSE